MNHSIGGTADRSGRVVIADSDAAVRRQVRDELQEAGFAVAAAVAGGAEAQELIVHYQPDIAILDLDPPRIDGISMTATISREVPEVRVLIHARHDDVESQLAAFRAGAAGFIAKGAAPGGVARSARALLRGETVVSRRLSTTLIERFRAVPEPEGGMRPIKSPLTPREWEVADLLARGLDTKDIAAELVLSQETVYTHVKHVLRKLEVHTREEAVEATNRMRAAGS